MRTPGGKSFAVLLTLLVLSTDAFRLPRRGKGKKIKYPFNQLVAFGDQLSDDGSGSWAHGLDPNNAYGNHTWTDGPVAVTYLADLLNVPLLDFAWGGAYGGGLAGSTVNNDYTPAKDSYRGKPVPATYDQIFSNYTGKNSPFVSNIKHALQFIWIGQNDVKKHTNWYANPPSLITPTAKPNVAFYNNFTSLLLTQVEHLASLGAPGIVVVNLYPINVAPITDTFLCHNNTQCINNWGKVIDAANSFLENALSQSKYASKIIYYDVNGFLTHVMNNKNSYGYTRPLDDVCDNGNASSPFNFFKVCAQPPKWTNARPFFWFTNDQPETTAHQLIAGDMLKTIQAHFAANTTSS